MVAAHRERALSRARGIPYEAIFLSLLLGLTALLALYNLPYYPRTWFDEGSHLHVPKSLVLFGQYADYSSEGFRYDGPTVGVGPTVLLPIAGAFQAFGIGLEQARLVIVAYMALALLLFYLLSRRVFGPRVALAASFLLLASPGVSFLEFGRQVLGEVPALAFFLAGALLWLTGVEKGRLRDLLLAGLMFGLAMVTKTDYALILPPTLGLLWIYERLTTRRVRFSQVFWAMFAAGVPFGLWYAYQLFLLDPAGFLANADRVRSASAGSVLVVSASRSLSSLKFLISPDLQFGWLVPAVLYALVRVVRKASSVDVKQEFLLSFVVTWLGWYALASIGWPRYAFPALVVGTLLVAKLLVDVVDRLLERGTDAVALPRLQALCVGLVVLVMVVYPLQETAKAILTQPDRSAQQFAQMLDADVQPSQVVETWEPELEVLSNLRFHYPPTALLDQAVKKQWFDSQLVTNYDPFSAHPAYVAVGRFGKWTGIYDGAIKSGALKLVGSVGEYDLYQVVGAR